MNKYICYIFALSAVVTLIMTGCGGTSTDHYMVAPPEYIAENTIQVNPDGSIDTPTQSGVSIRAYANTFDPDVKVKISANKSFEGIDGAFHSTSSLFTFSAEKVKSTSYGETSSKVTNVQNPVTLSVPNDSNEPGVYYIGVRDNSDQDWQYALVNDKNSPNNPLPVFTRASGNNNATEFYISTYKTDFQFAVFIEKAIDPSKTVITDFKAEAEPSEYLLVDGKYKNDITVKATIFGDQIGNLTSNNYAVEIGFLNDDGNNYNATSFPISGAIAKYNVSDKDAGAGNKYMHTITLTSISDYSNNTLSFGIGASKLTQNIFPADFTITVKVNEAPNIVAYSQTKGITLKNVEGNFIKVLSTSPEDGATEVLPDTGSIVVKFDNELASDNDWASYITLTDANNIIPVEVTYSDKTLYINYNKLSSSTKYTLHIKDGLKGTEKDAVTEAFTMTFTTKGQAITTSLTAPTSLKNVKPTANIMISFSDKINWENESKNLVTLCLGENPIECKYSYLADNNFLTLTPANKLLYNKTYTINISKSLTNSETDQIFEFSTLESAENSSITPDTSKSEDGKFYLVSGQKFYIDFNRPIIDEVTAKSSVYLQKSGTALTDYTTEFDTAKQVITICINLPFEADQTYTVGVKEFSDSDGTIARAAEDSFKAMTEIAVESIELNCGSDWQTASGTSDATVSGKIKVTFNQPVQPAAVKLLDNAGSEVNDTLISNKTAEKNSIIEFDYNGLDPLSTYGVVASYIDTATGQSIESGVHTFITTVPDCLVLANPSLPNSESNPYLVYSAKALDQIRENDYLAKGYYFKQMVDIDLSPTVYSSSNNTVATGWKPFGRNPSTNSQVEFNGHYDGNNKTISNLTSSTESEKECPSLFGIIGTGSVINLSLENINLNGKKYVGAIAGRINDVEITNCHSTGNIVVYSSYAGGLIGHVDYITLSDSHSEVNITTTSHGEYDSCVGGLIGYIYETGDVTNCYATGNISGPYRVGGIIGSSWEGTIKGCYTTNLTVTGLECVGGLIGSVDSLTIITDCHCDNVTINVYEYASGCAIGGLIGWNAAGEISDCQTSGTVTGRGPVGGVIGINGDSEYGKFGIVKGLESKCAVYGFDYLGGVIGANDNGSYENLSHTGPAPVGIDSEHTPEFTGELVGFGA